MPIHSNATIERCHPANIVILSAAKDLFASVTLFSLIPHHPISLRSADNSRKACLLQTLQRTLRDTSAGLAIWITNIVIKTTTTFEHPEELLIKHPRIKLPCQAKRWWIMDNSRKTAIFEALYNLVSITHYLMDFG